MHCPCGCQDADARSDVSSDPIDILADQADNDPLSAYERGRVLAGIEMRRRELDAMRVRFSAREYE